MTPDENIFPVGKTELATEIIKVAEDYDTWSNLQLEADDFTSRVSLLLIRHGEAKLG